MYSTVLSTLVNKKSFMWVAIFTNISSLGKMYRINVESSQRYKTFCTKTNIFIPHRLKFSTQKMLFHGILLLCFIFLRILLKFIYTTSVYDIVNFAKNSALLLWLVIRKIVKLLVP